MRIAQPGAVLFFAVVSFSGCDQTTAGSSRSSGSVAISKDDALIYAVDTDNGLLAVVDAKSKTLLTTVTVGARPYRLAVAPDETIYVANRGSRSVSVIRKGDWKVSATLSTDVDPVGLTLSPDGNTLLVACATASDSSAVGTLTAFDTVGLQRQWTVSLPDEARSVAWVDHNGGQAVVGLYRSGDVALVDVASQKVIQAGSDAYSAINSSSTGAFGGVSTTVSAHPSFHPRAVTDVVLTPEGKRVFALGELSTEGLIPPPPPPPTPGSITSNPYYQAKGPGFAGSVSTAAVFSFDTGAQLSPAVDDLWNQGDQTADADHPQTSYANTGLTGDPLVQGPTAGAVDPKGEWLYVLSRESANVIAVPTASKLAHATLNADGSNRFNQTPSIFATGDVGPGADGLAVSSDNHSLWVYSQFDHRLSELALDNSTEQLTLKTASSVTVAGETLDPTLAAGRKLFHDANDRRISARTAAIACSSCHLEGRDDTHVWHFPDGPRQTPSLAGRGLLETAPYHWSGEFATLSEFLTHTLTTRMGGSGLDDPAADSLNRYIASLAAPENPYQSQAPTEAQKRGAILFAQAGCATCHTGQWMTTDVLTDVGTRSNTDLVQQLNVPSLRGLARSAPYLHDGSAPTLLARLQNNPGDLHGATSALSADQLTDLVAYLNSL